MLGQNTLRSGVKDIPSSPEPRCDNTFPGLHREWWCGGHLQQVFLGGVVPHFFPPPLFFLAFRHLWPLFPPATHFLF